MRGFLFTKFNPFLPKKTGKKFAVICSRKFLLLRLKENQIEIEKEVSLLRTEQNGLKGISLLINRDTSCPSFILSTRKDKVCCIVMGLMSGFCIHGLHRKP